MKRVHPQEAVIDPHNLRLSLKVRTRYSPFRCRSRDLELHPRGSCIPIFHIVARECILPQARMSKPHRAILPFSPCLGSSRRGLIYFLTFISLPPTHLVVLVLLVRVIKTPSFASPLLGDHRRNGSVYFVWDLCLGLYSTPLHCRSLLARQTWHIGYSGYHPLLPELLGRRPLLTGIGSWVVGDILGNDAWRSSFPATTESPPTGLRSPVWDWVLRLFSHRLALSYWVW